MEIRIKGTTPVRATPGAAGVDLCCDPQTCYLLRPGEAGIISTGLSMEIPYGVVGLVFARSGLALQGITLANGVGVIDSDYRGEIKVLLENRTRDVVSIDPGQRIAQLVFVPHVVADFVVVDELNDTPRGSGGFGSTGK